MHQSGNDPSRTKSGNDPGRASKQHGSNIKSLEGKELRLSDGGAQAGAEASMGLARHQTRHQCKLVDSLPMFR